MDPALVIPAQRNMVWQTDEAPAEGLQKDLNAAIFESEFPGSHTPPFRDAVKTVEKQVAPLGRLLEDDQSPEGNVLRGKIKFFKNFSPVDKEIFQSMIASVPSTWGKASDPAECERTQLRNKALIEAVRLSIQKSDVAIGRKALKDWPLPTKLQPISVAAEKERLARTPSSVESKEGDRQEHGPHEDFCPRSQTP